MLDRLHRLHPFQTPETRRLATLFAVVYFAQGMWSLPVQTLTLVLKERGLSSSAVADFFLIRKFEMGSPAPGSVDRL